MADENVTQEQTNKKINWAIGAGAAVLIGLAALLIQYCNVPNDPVVDAGLDCPDSGCDAGLADAAGEGEGEGEPTPVCGNGVTEPGEICDDGNAVNTDSCLTSCVSATCGDTHIQSGVEECDDGNAVNTDNCLSGCVLAKCGDSIVEQQVEECDDGNVINTDNCLTNCTAPVCGDGNVWSGHEQCDDGNQNNTDSCATGCTLSRCGDGFVRSGVEECDDGNAVNTDSCLMSCVIARCGDAIVRPETETCDDGNIVSGDGCSNVCSIEPPPIPVSGGPTTLYTDLLSAPPGAWVTVWGRRFGSTLGQVVFSGSPSSTTPFSWSDQMIVYQVPATTPTGSYTLQIRTASGELSNSQPLAIHQGTVRQLANVSGMLAALSSLQQGDVLYLRAGTYTRDTTFNSVIGWNNTTVSGTATRPLAIVAYPGETVVIGNNTLERGIYHERPTEVQHLNYVTYSKLIVKGRCLGFQLGGRTHNGRIVGNDITGQGGSGCVDGAVALGNSGWKVLGNIFHDNSASASKYNHGVYLPGFGTNSNIEIAWNIWRNHRGGRAIQIYGHVANDVVNNIRIHDNEFYGVDRDGILVGGSDAGSMNVSDVHIYNNIIFRAGRCTGYGIRIANSTARQIEVFNNTLVDNGGGYNSCSESGPVVNGQVSLENLTSATFRNNIFSALGNQRFLTVIAGVTLLRNLYHGSASVPVDTQAISGDPLFVDSNAQNYHLTSLSPALNIGTALGILAPLLDHDALSRVFGSGLDLGAYEYQN